MKGKDNKGISLIVLIIIIAIIIGIVIAVVCLLNNNKEEATITNNENKQTEISSNTNNKETSNKSNASDKLSVYINDYKVIMGTTTYNELLQNTNFEEVDYRGDSGRACINDGYSEINLELKDGKIEWISTYKDNQVDCGYVFDTVNSKIELFGGLKIGMTLEDAERIYGDYSYPGSSSYDNDDGTKSKIYYWNKKRDSAYSKLDSYGSLEVSVDEETNIIQNIAVFREFNY